MLISQCHFDGLLLELMGPLLGPPKPTAFLKPVGPLKSICPGVIVPVSPLSPPLLVRYVQPIVPVEVDQVIQNQNSKKAADPQNIPIKFYKIAGKWIANFLNEYFNKCLEHGYFPNALKLAKVKPIFKPGKHSSMNNYRPRASEKKFSRGYEGRYRAPKSWAAVKSRWV